MKFHAYSDINLVQYAKILYYELINLHFKLSMITQCIKFFFFFFKLNNYQEMRQYPVNLQEIICLVQRGSLLHNWGQILSNSS